MRNGLPRPSSVRVRLPWAILAAISLVVSPARGARVEKTPNGGERYVITRTELRDRIRGGWAGQMIGNLQGLPYEFKYKNEPGPLPDFTPNLPEARTDDDTDIEWVHLLAMDRYRNRRVPYPIVAREWVRSINDRIWVSNKRARELMSEGIIPPWTSYPALNPHASYNLSGQFCVEAYGFIAPGLPNEAAQIGSHYAKITVRGEPIQACAYWTSMISLAFFENDIATLARRCLQSVDPKSQHAEMVRDVLEWYEELPEDWQALRGRVQKKYRDERGWNMNATITNGAFVLAALLYGDGDFVETMRYAFALGYDADCNAATCGAILGVMHGANEMESHAGWVLPTVYVNNSRDGLPPRQTMDELVDLTMRIAHQTIIGSGGAMSGETLLYIPVQEPELLERLALPAESKEDVLEAIDREALQVLRRETLDGLEAGARAERTFAAIRLVESGTGDLREAERENVIAVLRDAKSDPVLAPLADKALKRLEESE